jgi:putative CocE/NonD family hydrolase
MLMKNFLAKDKVIRSALFILVLLALISGCARTASTVSPAPGETSAAAPEATSTPLPTNTPDGRVSQPGVYKGYSQPLYSEISTTSQYIPTRDGTKLAALIMRPAQNGTPVSTPLPVIWTHMRYHRERILDWPWLPTVLKHGYVIVAVDVRGSGASYGKYLGTESPEETRDAYDITEWLAIQPWSDGNIGMYGRSYMGITQYMAASTAPPHLKAIFPEMAEIDHYSFFYSGGVFRDDFVRQWGNMINGLDKNGLAVDEDLDKTMLQEAQKEHGSSLDMLELYSNSPYRDSTSALTGTQVYILNNPATYLNEIRNSGIPVYIWQGWNDMFPRDALLWYSNLTNPKKITMGPWSHPELGSLDLATEQLRWYDYWLKGIDNGVMSEAPIYYYTMGEGKKVGWHPAWQWPLPEEKRTNYYFDGANSGSVKSINDGSLSLALPETSGGKDQYTVDYSTTSGKSTRWTAGYSQIPPAYSTMMFNDAKGLTYTTAPLAAQVEVTGHPVVHLWITSSAKDGDFFVYLEDISEANFSKYVTEGNLRASQRAVSSAPYETLGLPYHRSYAEDIADLPGEPVELVLDLLPTSYIFDAGHRIRVTITGADKDNALTPQLDPPPTVTLYHDSDHASYIEIPIIPNP